MKLSKVGLLAVAIAVAGLGLNQQAVAEEGCHGTSVNFLDSPAEAAKQALEDEKLVLVLHVSGNFETPDYT